MKISRFYGANTRDVMRQVREALGPDALIVSNRSVEGGIEVLATVDGAFDDAPAQTPPQESQGQARLGLAQLANIPQPHTPQPHAPQPHTSQPHTSQPQPQPGYAQPSYPHPHQERQPASSPFAAPAGAERPLAAPAAMPSFQPPAAMPAAGYAAPSRSIAAYQSAYAASALPADEPSTAPASFATPVSQPVPSASQPAASVSQPAPSVSQPAPSVTDPVALAANRAPAAPAAASAPATPMPGAAVRVELPALAPASAPVARMAAAAAPSVHMATSAAPAAHMAAVPSAHMAAAPATAYQESRHYAAPAAPAMRAPDVPAVPTQPPAPPAMARTPDAPVRPPHGTPPASLPGDTAAGLQDAISALRGALESRMDGLLWGGRQGPGREPAGAALFRSLLDAGFSTKLVRTLVERLPQGLGAEAALSWARNELVTHLPVLRSEDEFLAGGVYALVGPTGVGKTTTLAKLAARCVAREGREQVAMLTTDLFRIGALEQLQIYGRLMGVPAHSVRDAGELRRILAELGNRKIVLIDTTGISQRDRLVAEQASMLCNAGKPVRRLLVLNAASQGDTLDEVAHAYRNGVGEDVAGCIITKLDEATRLGAALDTAIRHRLPIHYMSVGQKVPEHMELARADVLIDRAFSMVERARALYTPSEADLASLVSSSREPDAVDPVRRRQLLASAILPQQGGAASIAAAQRLDDTIAWLDNDAACLQARTAWREYVGDGAGASLAALGDEPLAMARREFSAACSRNLLVMHGKTAMKGEGLPGGTLLGAVLMSDRGAALAAPAQQLVLPHGMLTSFAPAAPAQPDPAAALAARVRWLGERLPSLPLVHMLEAGTAALWQSFSDQGVSWVARCPGGLRVSQDECPTNLNAVGKSVGYLPVGQPGDMPGLRLVRDGKTVPLALWASGTEVVLPAKGQGASVRLVCARLIDTVSGEVAGQLFGATNLPASQADAATIARWLVLQDEAKAAFRYMANAWQALPAVDGAHTLARQSLMAGQLGAACWQLAHSPAAEVVRGPLSGIVGVGSERKLSGKMLPVALLKMFALLEMTGGA
ncbi:flagellar biosynthesis protein FlhF [Achromobacter sp. MFA1 R4]|uniref:flagellar biosynthesis protein FlhF n=1 Tax=Achromobacter sp. MFA1 R4 TaxID=1881016 RepID=UPI00095373AA|nr:flagellar biosynthesis protein FlhF [Achromobacter sp. MFA1 R4]SIT32399.1 flagellar biosynthesis protein FlhF [Achromobacter sp. MFA1 R4]